MILEILINQTFQLLIFALLVTSLGQKMYKPALAQLKLSSIWTKNTRLSDGS
jgi:hypothetical protein